VENPSTRAALDAAHTLLLAGQSLKAKKAYQAVEKEAAARGDARGEALARLGVGDAWTLRSGWDEAVEAYQGVTDPSVTEAARLRTVWVQSFRGGRGTDRAKVESDLQDALQRAESSGDDWIAARLVSRLVEMPALSSDPKAALAKLNDALQALSKRGDVFGRAVLLRPRGRVLLDLKRPAEAEDSLNRARALLKGSDTPGLTSRVLQDLGILHSRGGAMAEALKMYQEAATYATELPRAYAACLRNIGVIYAKQGNYPLSRQAMEEALRTSEAHEDRPGQVRTLQNLGQLSAHFGDLETARDYFSRSMPMVPEVLNSAGQASAWVNLGRLELVAGDLSRGEEAFHKALTLAEELPGSSAVQEARLGLGEASLRRGDFPAALKAGREAARSEQAEIFRRGKVLAARAQRASGKSDAALATLLGAVEVTEDRMARIAGGARDQELFLDDSFQVYGELIDLLADRGEIAEAFSWAERVKGRSLLRALSSPRAPKPRNQEQRAQEARLVERLVTLNQDRFRPREDSPQRSAETRRVEEELKRARLNLERFRTELYAEQAGLRRSRADVPVFSPEESRDPDQAWPPADTVVLEMVTLETKTLLFVLRSAQPRLRVVEVPVGWLELAGLTEQLRQRLADRSPAYSWAATRLYELLIAPVEKDLAGAQQICVVPDGPLWDVPLQLLAPRGGKILGERFTLYTAPSVSLLASLRSLRKSRAEGSGTGKPRAAPPGSLLAVGDPAFSKDAMALVSGVRGFSPLARLPEAAEEAREVAAAYGQAVEVLVGEEARESRIKALAGRFRTLHFATHALMDDRNPSFSTLVLAPDPGEDGTAQEDGLLETWEVASLDLDADLVVLAGCQTHRGRVRTARGLMGLSWAFASAGSPAVVASHWDVDSKATRELMVRFHRLRQGGATTAEALRQAALAVRQKPEFRHPFFWAGFTLVGVPD